MKNTFLILIGSALLLINSAGAEPAKSEPSAEQKIRASLRVLLPNLRPDSVSPTPVAGLYEVIFGTRLVYVTEDGRYLLQGKVIDLETREEITDGRLQGLKREAMARVSEDDMIVYGPDDAEYTVDVFTDIDCGYCRKLHSQIDEYGQEGIRVRYLAYPRAGVGSESYDKAVSVWCADDRRAAMNTAKDGKPVEKRKCDNPVADQYQLGGSIQIRGTPAIVLESGEILPGYVPPKTLRKTLDQKGKAGG